jgi:arylsulfatase A-like enzyme
MTRPNILFLMPDQLRADFLGCYGAGFARTPNLDALAKRSTVFDRCLSPNPICVPARASLLTGASTLETRVIDNGNWLAADRAARGLHTWPELLSQAGYRTYGVGKMHFTPWDAAEGFDTRIIAEDKRHTALNDDYAAYLATIGQTKVHGRDMPGYAENAGACISPLSADQQVDAWCAERACDLLRAHDPNQPFAMMIGFPSPHCPYDPPADIAALFDPADMPPALTETESSRELRPWLVENMKNLWADIDYSTFTDAQKAKVRAHYSALIHLVDRAVGRVLAALDDIGLADNTVVIFASDHGDFVGDFGMVCKNFFMDPSVRVPMIVHRPGQHPERRADAVELSDVFPTVLGLAGLEVPAGCTFRDLLAPPPETPRAICGAVHRGMMVEQGEMKLSRYRQGPVTLHDIANDPDEQVNLAHDPALAAIRDGLERLLTDWQINETLKGHAPHHS